MIFQFVLKTKPVKELHNIIYIILNARGKRIIK